jgi:hypothetical protein
LLVLELVVAALGGGIVATALAAWVSWLRRFESARMQCMAEIDRHVVTAALVDREGGDHGVSWSPGWERYRDTLGMGLVTRDPGLWDDLETLLAGLSVLAIGGFQYSVEQRRELDSLKHRLRGLAPGWVAGTFTYGLRYAAVRKRWKGMVYPDFDPAALDAAMGPREAT